MASDTFQIRNCDYPLSEVIGFSHEDFIVSFEHKYETLTQEQFGDFLIVYGNWIKQRKKVVNYPDGWYKVTNTNGDVNLIKLFSNRISNPLYKGSWDKININNGWWEKVEPIDPNSDEFFIILSEMF